MAKAALKLMSLKKVGATTKRSAKSTVAKKTLHRADGKRVQVRALDANSPTFESDLTAIFRLNVAKARRENRQTRARLPKEA
jgi:hypothetical protein